VKLKIPINDKWHIVDNSGEGLKNLKKVNDSTKSELHCFVFHKACSPDGGEKWVIPHHETYVCPICNKRAPEDWFKRMRTLYYMAKK